MGLQKVGGKYYFILSIFKSGDDRVGGGGWERKTHTAACGFRATVCGCVWGQQALTALLSDRRRTDGLNKKFREGGVRERENGCHHGGWGRGFLKAFNLNFNCVVEYICICVPCWFFRFCSDWAEKHKTVDEFLRQSFSLSPAVRSLSCQRPQAELAQS